MQSLLSFCENFVVYLCTGIWVMNVTMVYRVFWCACWDHAALKNHIWACMALFYDIAIFINTGYIAKFMTWNFLAFYSLNFRNIKLIKFIIYNLISVTARDAASTRVLTRRFVQTPKIKGKGYVEYVCVIIINKKIQKNRLIVRIALESIFINLIVMCTWLLCTY